MASVNGAWAKKDDDLTVSVFINLAKEDSQLLGWVGETGQAFLVTNIELREAGLKEFYCQPESQSISKEQYLGILVRYVDQHPHVKALSFHAYQQALLYGLEETYPCQGK